LIRHISDERRDGKELSGEDKSERGEEERFHARWIHLIYPD
jgi:hypothetical protein